MEDYKFQQIILISVILLSHIISTIAIALTGSLSGTLIVGTASIIYAVWLFIEILNSYGEDEDESKWY